MKMVLGLENFMVIDMLIDKGLKIFGMVLWKKVKVDYRCVVCK